MYNLKFEIELATNYQSETEIPALSSIPGQRIFDSALLVENYINVRICIKERGRLIWLKIGMRRNQIFEKQMDQIDWSLNQVCSSLTF